MNNITKIAEMMVELVQSQLDEGITLTAIEQTTRTLLQEVGRQTVEMALERMEIPYPEPRIPCNCGAEANYVRRRTACLQTLFGQLQAKRAYYLCSTCHQGTFPLDEQLRLRPNALSAKR